MMIYLHGRGGGHIDNGTMVPVLVEMAQIAKWDILRIIRVPYVDVASEDDHQLEFIGRQVAQARHEGYRKVFVAGASRGGWLAVVAAALDSVDGVIGLAPGTTSNYAWARDELARRLSMARTKRIAVFFFEGDFLEEVPRSETTRQALESTQSAYMFVDKPPDLIGHSGPVYGRFTRRYRDCLLQFMRTNDVRPGVVQCRTDRGYAVGEEIGFSIPSVRSSDEALAPYGGRWQGDDRHGTYAIFQAVEARPGEILARLGLSPPSHRRAWSPRSGEVVFQRDSESGGLLFRSPGSSPALLIEKKSEVELELQMTDATGKFVTTLTLRRQPGG
jgi:pimeloyl-ACP methyl ester carboxylesterase